MFTHLIYFRRSFNSVVMWDPATDLLVEPTAYLLWRHVRQTVPSEVVPYGGVILDRHHLSVVRFSHDLYFEGVDEWMKQARRSYGNLKLGFHEYSRYRSILRPLFFRDRDKDLNERLPLINEFFEEFHSVPGGHIPWRRSTVGGGNTTDEWNAIKGYFIDSCLDIVPTAA